MRIVRSRNKGQELLIEYAAARRKAEDAKREQDLIAEALVTYLESEEQKSVSVDDGGKRIQATHVQTNTTVVDEPGLKKATGAVKYRKLCKQVLDRSKLQEAIDTGELDQMIVAQYLTNRPNKASIRFTEKASDDDQ